MGVCAQSDWSMLSSSSNSSCMHPCHVSCLLHLSSCRASTTTMANSICVGNACVRFFFGGCPQCCLVRFYLLTVFPGAVILLIALLTLAGLNNELSVDPNVLCNRKIFPSATRICDVRVHKHVNNKRNMLCNKTPLKIVPESSSCNATL